MIQRAVITGLTAAGVDVADLRVSPSAVTRQSSNRRGSPGVHVAQSALDPEQCRSGSTSRPGIQLTAGLEKRIEKNFTRQELRRSAFEEVGQTTYPTRVRGATRIGSSTRSTRRHAWPRLPDRRRLGFSDLVRPSLVLGPSEWMPSPRTASSTRRGPTTHHWNRLPTTPRGSSLRSPPTSASCSTGRGGLRRRRTRRTGSRGDRAALVRLLVDTGRTGTIAVPVTVTSLVDTLVEKSGLVTRTPLAQRPPRRQQLATTWSSPARSAGATCSPTSSGYDAVASSKLLELLALPNGRCRARRRAARPSLVHRSLPCRGPARASSCGCSTSASPTARLDPRRDQGVRRAGLVHVLPDPDEPLVHVFAEATNGADSGKLADELQHQIELIVQGGVPARTGKPQAEVDPRADCCFNQTARATTERRRPWTSSPTSPI